MDSSRPTSVPGDGTPPVTEADLHARADDRLTPARQAEIDAWLQDHPDERQRVDDWRAQNLALRQWLEPVMAEPLPLRMPLGPARRRGRNTGADAPAWRSLAAGVAIALASTGATWWARGAYDTHAARAQAGTALAGFAKRAAVAHVVYSPDLRRPVEVGADQEQALVTWLTKRMGAQVQPPDLRALGYALIGGRLLPGGQGPVAQFMFSGADGVRLTLYLTREDAGRETAFRFGQEGGVNVFYWVDRDFGYALSSSGDRQQVLRVAEAVYRQLEARR